MKKVSVAKLVSIVLSLTLILGSAPIIGDFSYGSEIPVLEDEEEVNVCIVLEDAALSDRGYALKGIGDNKRAMAVREKMINSQEKMADRISEEALDGEVLDVNWNLTLFINAMSAKVKESDIEKIKEVAGVKSVFREKTYRLLSDNQVLPETGVRTALSNLESGAMDLWESGYTGAGKRIAIVDSSTFHQHEVFDEDCLRHSFEENATKAGLDYDTYKNGLNLLTKGEIDSKWSRLNVSKVGNFTPNDVYVSMKVPYAFNYERKNTNVSDIEGKYEDHGTHVAGIAAANKYVKRGGEYVDNLGANYVRGTAYDAQIIVLSCAGDSSIFSELIAALEDAVVLGCDVINASYGGSAPGQGMFTEDDSLEKEVVEKMEEAGIVFACAAGNEMAWSNCLQNLFNTGVWGSLYADDVTFSTQSSPSCYPGTVAVGSVDAYVGYNQYIRQGGNRYEYRNDGLDGIDSLSVLSSPKDDVDYEYVYLESEGTEEELDTFTSETGIDFSGKIVFLNLGEIKVDKAGENAVSRGAVATIMILDGGAGTLKSDNTYPFHQPLSFATASAIARTSTTNGAISGGSISYHLGTVTVERFLGTVSSPSNEISYFSSWGGSESLTIGIDFLTIGGNVRSSLGIGGKKQYYDYYDGTSMATPNTSGYYALVLEAIDKGDITGAGISRKNLATSLLMSTATPLKNGGDYYSVISQGAGIINLRKLFAANSFITIDPSSSIEDTKFGKVKIELGDDPNRSGHYSFSFNVNNMSSSAISYDLSADFFTQGLSTTANRYNNNGQGFGEYKAVYNTEVRKEETETINKDSITWSGTGVAGSAVTVPANGSVKVTCDVVLSTGGGINQLGYYDKKGTYIEGYAFIKERSTQNEEHSIPIFGYYGNWTEPTMYDRGSYTDYIGATATENIPYFTYYYDVMEGKRTLAFTRNTLTAAHKGKAEVFYKGGNGFFDDSDFYPERESFRPGDTIKHFIFSLIRDAAATRIQIFDNTQGTTLFDEEYGHISAGVMIADKAYGVTSKEDINYVIPQSLDGHEITVKVTAVPEHYIKNCVNVYDPSPAEWDAIDSKLSDGAIKTFSYFIDNTKPVVNSTEFVSPSGILKVNASDNRYIAGMELYDARKTTLIATCGAIQNASLLAGSNNDYSLADVPEGDYVLMVYDYAGNETSHVIGNAYVAPGGGGGGGGGGAAASGEVPAPVEEIPVGEEQPPITILEEIKDVSTGDWYYESVSFVTAKGLMQGVSETSFNPNGKLNRGMLVTILYRLAGCPAVENKAQFADVAEGQWYADAVAWASANGIVNGVGGASFAPNADITREQFATMLMRYAKFTNMDVSQGASLSSYADAGKVSSYASESLAWANAMGILTGRTDTELAPDGSTTRAETATMLMRFIQGK